MRKTVAILIMAFVLICCVSFSSYAAGLPEEEEVTTEHAETTEYPDEVTRQPDLVADAAIVMDVATGQVLYEKNAHEQKYPASITKILTVAIALEHGLDFNKTIEMSENSIWSVDRDSSLIGLDVGEQVTLGDLVYATMIKSDNSCAYALAEYVAGNVESFAALMNEKAAALGCKHSHFVTPNGLPDEDHYTTAYDMALITRYALQNETFRQVAGTLSYTVPATNLTDETRPLWNGNKMINPSEPYYYEYCEGGKTGYTMTSNNTLVTFSKKDGLELICVILDCDGSRYAYTDSRALYNYCYNNYTYFYPLSDFNFSPTGEYTEDTNVMLDNYYASLNHDMVDLQVDNSYVLLVNKSMDTTKIEHSIILYDEPQENTIGEIQLLYEGEQLGSTPITTTTPHLSSKMELGIEERKNDSVFQTIGKIVIRILIVVAALSIVLLLYGFLSTLIRNTKNNKRRRRYSPPQQRRRRRDDDYYL
ncbi:MAG: D-alanyl-D-alanine carboxypeptidase [Lachnospiraceae bacterium]|nr:D-alanyl-D-alanine carboxypeptidase [Lachnospiraceae bacterium]